MNPLYLCYCHAMVQHATDKHFKGVITKWRKQALVLNLYSHQFISSINYINIGFYFDVPASGSAFAMSPKSLLPCSSHQMEDITSV